MAEANVIKCKARCSSGNVEYLASAIDYSMMACNEIMNTVGCVPKNVSTNVTSINKSS